MAESSQPTPARKAGLMLPILVGLALAALGGGGAFYAVWAGWLLPQPAETDTADVDALPDLAFVPIDPVIISLPPGARSEHLRFTAQLEVNARHTDEVRLLLPRILDVLNGYLRAIDVAEFEDPAALMRIRAQLLRRIQLVVGDGRVRDLLITEFVLN